MCVCVCVCERERERARNEHLNEALTRTDIGSIFIKALLTINIVWHLFITCDGAANFAPTHQSDDLSGAVTFVRRQSARIGRNGHVISNSSQSKCFIFEIEKKLKEVVTRSAILKKVETDQIQFQSWHQQNLRPFAGRIEK